MVGLAVFGPDGERIGKVRDVVATLRVDASPPRVLGLVVELASRRRIFVPMLRVTGVDPGAITLATGSVSLRQFTQRPNETLVVGQLLDAPVRMAETGEEVVVVDAAIEPTRTRDWVVGRLAVRSRRTRLTRRAAGVDGAGGLGARATVPALLVQPGGRSDDARTAHPPAGRDGGRGARPR